MDELTETAGFYYSKVLDGLIRDCLKKWQPIVAGLVAQNKHFVSSSTMLESISVANPLVRASASIKMERKRTKFKKEDTKAHPDLKKYEDQIDFNLILMLDGLQDGEIEIAVKLNKDGVAYSSRGRTNYNANVTQRGFADAKKTLELLLASPLLTTFDIEETYEPEFV